MSELNIADIANQAADAASTKEANAPFVVSKGTYRLHLTKRTADDGTPREGSSGKQRAPFIRFETDAIQKGEKKGKLFFNGTWEDERIEAKDGRRFLSREARLYRNLVGALGLPEDGTATVADVLGRFENNDVAGSVGITLKSPEGDYFRQAKGSEDFDVNGARLTLRDAVAQGYTPYNEVNRIFELKDGV